MTADYLHVPIGDLRALSPDWLSTALARSHPGAVVSAAQVMDATAGTTTRVRLKLAYSAGSGPERVFVKAQGRLGHRLMLLVIGMLNAEARFYACADTMAGMVPVLMPVGYAAATDRRTLSSVVVLEDITAGGATPNIATTPLDVDTVGRGVDALSRLHARYWAGTDAYRRMSWLPVARTTPGWAFTIFGGTRKGIGKAAAHGLDLPAAAQSPAQLTTLYRRAITDVRAGPRTVLHGDTHIGNTFTAADGDLGFLDWQLVRRGSWQHDLAYFVTSALTVADRAEHEAALLRRYLRGLAGTGVAAPTWDEAWARYRRCAPYGLAIWLATLGWSDYQSDEVSLATAARFASAFVDHRCGQR